MTRTLNSIAALIILAAGAALVGCASDESASATTRTQTLEARSDRPTSAPEITLNMRRFDAGIGDTNTGVGGGGNGY